MPKNTFYLVVEYLDEENKFNKTHCDVNKYSTLVEISNKYNVPVKTISKLITGEKKGIRGQSSIFVKNKDIFKISKHNLKNYDSYIQQLCM